MNSPLLFLILLSTTSAFNIFAASSKCTQGHIAPYRQSVALNANPINSEGSKYRGDITEEEAFLWFDEAMVRICCLVTKSVTQEKKMISAFLRNSE